MYTKVANQKNFKGSNFKGSKPFKNTPHNCYPPSGHNREVDPAQKASFFHPGCWLKEAAERYHCRIHAYVLMSNHIHLLATPKEASGITRLMQYVGRYYVPYINRTYGGSGSIWEGRYKASLVQQETYLLACMRYIELNPVRANMVKTPGQYRWSSFRRNGQGKSDELVEAHSL